ncbi:glucuronyl esterase domain-containing protein [Parenemella sanctibonifatiensis]|uniref:Acetylxylan esterase n=1 Tax=Parenemella sanctibonifatiensis TaxID=2016505 RepID=A0A255EDM7_9ACTN|nr:hypothetical protein [Parenemella sanctibonifatiensis]OYN89370.1 acetylxylan esterase [Parenemella sanctibonifatiensis]
MTVQADPVAWPDTLPTWQAERAAVAERWASQIYGHQPTVEAAATTELLTETALPDGGVRRQVALHLAAQPEHGDPARWSAVLLVDLPAGASAEQPAPAFLGHNFKGNHACTDDPQVWRIEEHPREKVGQIFYEAGEPSKRGENARRWDLDAARARGYAVVTLCYRQVGPDDATTFEQGLYPVVAEGGLHNRDMEAPGAISLWAWVLSRVLDEIGHGPLAEIDPSRVCAVGHSRLGKTALWASACDERFAAAISNNSGALGAALSRPVGETALVLAHVRPYWFGRHFSNVVSAGRPLELDQPLLIALSAPRPIYVSSATEDLWADPEGELASLAEASRVWQWYGDAGISNAFPEPNGRLHPDGSVLAYHLREGKHDVQPFDWANWLDWADRTWGR